MIKINRLTQVAERVGKSALFLCECGTRKLQSYYGVKSGKIKSCGCLSREAVIKRNKESSTHRMTGSSEYNSWLRMKARCSYEKDKDFPNYGGRGIKVCDRWINSFENFIEDMGKKPSKGLTLDRKDTNEGYFKENCRWANTFVQSENKRPRGGTSKYRGVTKESRRNKWTTKITIPLHLRTGKRKTVCVGNFYTELEAAKAYDRKIVELGLPKMTNFPEDYIGIDTNILNKIEG